MATCGIRKLLDYVFTQRELFWLDDILPGSKLHEENNQKCKKQMAVVDEERKNEKVDQKNLIKSPKLLPLLSSEITE